MKKLFNKIRLKLVKKLIRPDDGYTYTGFSEGDPIKFYYQEDTNKYLLGIRSGTMYYFVPTLSSWSSYASRYLPWGEKYYGHQYKQEPQECDFQKWIFGIQENIWEEYKSHLQRMTPEQLLSAQEMWRKSEELINGAHRETDKVR